MPMRDPPLAGTDVDLKAIPAAVQVCEAAGVPVIVEHVPPLPVHTQRLYATLGCLVRFIPEPRG